jgi:ubiquinone/menaquinone biosynthesis C-methylase UbiE
MSRKKYDLNFIVNKVLPVLNKTNSELAIDEFSRPYVSYIKRIENLNLVGMKLGLDAGCGLGNWTFPLAEKNNEIIGIDFDSEKVNGANIISSYINCENARFIIGDLTEIPFEDNTFDFIFCYSVLMYTDSDKVIKEFKRLLVSGGKLYIMTDLWRWLLFPPNKNLLDLILYWLKMILMRVRGTKYKYFTKSSFERLITKNGFSIISSGQDGETSFDTLKSNSPRVSFYKMKKENFEDLWEVCAIKI